MGSSAEHLDHLLLLYSCLNLVQVLGDLAFEHGACELS